MGLFPLTDMEPFYDQVLSVEGDIFEGCTMSWSRMKSTILEGMWRTTSNHDEQSTIELSSKIILEVA